MVLAKLMFVFCVLLLIAGDAFVHDNNASLLFICTIVIGLIWTFT